MTNKEHSKLLGKERRKLILQWLQESETPITGSIIAKKTNVSRQVIVQDISLLKAKNQPIIATAQGYIYLGNQEQTGIKQVVACRHLPEATKGELLIMVDHGVTVVDVIVEHPIYGEITASLMLKNRQDVHQFINKVSETQASLLSELTDGVHLHTVKAETKKQIEDMCQSLKKAGFLLPNH